MHKNISFLFVLVILFSLCSCSKEEANNLVLQDKYDTTIKETEFTGEEFFVNLNARVLQPGERGQWVVLQGTVKDTFVYFEDKTDPFTRFKGIPGEEYTLEWRRWDANGNESTAQTKLKIPDLLIEIADNTPAEFKTIRFLSVNPKYRGTWSIDGTFGYIDSQYHDGYAEPAEKKPSIILHGYENRAYMATYTYIYAGKTYQYKKLIQTGSYTQDEGLYELQMSRDSYRVIQDDQGNILELNLQASAIAWIFKSPAVYPALTSFKKLRSLIFGGSSLDHIPTILGDYYLDLEVLSMDGVGSGAVFPENFGNLIKLKVFDYRPRFSVSPSTQVILPKSFAKLKALESFTLRSAGMVDFNGTLGSLTNLKTLDTYTLSLPDDFGNLKALQHLELYVKSPVFPKSFSECKSLIFARLTFDDLGGGTVVLPPQMGNLKKLETLELETKKLLGLPDSFSELIALKALRLSTSNLHSIPENFGNLSNLENLTVYGAFKKLPFNFGHLKKLSSLFVGGNLESLPESFGDLSSLSYFNGEYNQFKTLPNSFGKLKKLKELSLSFTKVEVLPASFSELDALEKLNLNATAFKSFPKEIIPLKSINNIILNNSNMGDIPDDISKMKTGVVFTMHGITNLTLDRLLRVVSITKNMVFYTSFGYYSSWNYG